MHLIQRSIMSLFSLSFICVCFSSLLLDNQIRVALAHNADVIDVGVVLDFETLLGKKNWASISLAMDDFCAAHGNITRRVILHPTDSQTEIVGAASAVVDLVTNIKVQIIIGPTTSSQTKFVANLGNRTHVPIVSSSATSPSLNTPYFVRATLNDSAQVSAIASIIKLHRWREVVPVYEDTEYGSGIIPFLVDALSSIDVHVPYRSVIPLNASDDWLNAELNELMRMQTRVFILHMVHELAQRLFQNAQTVGLMSEGYVWIASDGVTNELEMLDPVVLDSMKGMLGVHSYIPNSSALADFSARWHARFARDNPTDDPHVSPNIYQFRAYDAAWAVVLAVEKAGKLNTSFARLPRGTDYSTELAQLEVSKSGSQLLEELLGAQFHGLTGDFKLVDGQLQSTSFEIVNVIGKGRWRTVGFWSPTVKITKDLDNASDAGLKTVIWPGNLKAVPKGWEIPTKEKKLQIGVPVKKGFKQFINVQTDKATGWVNVAGYCIDIFEEVMRTLPYSVNYEYVPYYGDYDSLVAEVYYKKFDAVVGDITITADRSMNVDFTLPYTESGVSMVVPVKEDERNNEWIFLRPLTPDLWLTSLAYFFFTGFVVWVIEHRINTEFRGPLSQQMGTIFYFAFSTVVFAHKERLQSNLSRFAVIIWVFFVLILTSSYTASLTSMLTVQKLQPTVTELSELIENDDYIGYQDGSFVMRLFKNKGLKLRNYGSLEGYAEGLSLGSKNGGVAAICDEIPFLKLFLSEHCQDYVMVGKTYKAEGFGFVFPKGSPLVSDVSRAILTVTEGDAMAAIEKKWFRDLTTCPSDESSITSSGLNFQSFSGLFLITGCVSSLALILFLVNFFYKERDELKTSASENSIWRNIRKWASYYDRKDLSSHTFKNYSNSMNDGRSNHSNPIGDSACIPKDADGSQSPVSINVSGVYSGSPDVGIMAYRETEEQVIVEPAPEDAAEIVEIIPDT